MNISEEDEARLRRLLEQCPEEWGFEDEQNPGLVTAGRDRHGAWYYIDTSLAPAPVAQRHAELLVALKNMAPALLAALSATRAAALAAPAEGPSR